MPTLTPGRPLDSERPAVLVENPLAVGRHRFALTVVDGDGNESQPDELVLEVRGRTVVTPVVTPLPGVLPPIATPTLPPLRPVRRRTPR
jgi:hypothetical protein